MPRGYNKHNDYYKNYGYNKCDEYNKDYCDSLENILCSESNISAVLEELLSQDILNWLETVPDVQTRINLLTNVINTYSNRTCALSKLVCCSTELLKHCKQCYHTNCHQCDDKDNCNFKNKNKHNCDYSRCDCDFEEKCDEKCEDKCEDKSNKNNCSRKTKTPKQ